MDTSNKENTYLDCLPDCPFCGGKAVKSKYSESVICDCLRPSNTWVPLQIWENRSKDIKQKG